MPALEEVEESKEAQYVYVTGEENFESALNHVDTDVVANDTETTGLDPTKENVRCRILQMKGERDDVVSIFDLFTLPPWCKEMLGRFLMRPNRIKIFHNAKFDVKHLNVALDIDIEDGIYDTLLASQEIAAGDPEERHSLQDVVWKLFGIALSKDERMSNWAAPVLEHAQLAYGAGDVLYLHKIREIQKRKLKELGLNRTTKIEFDCIPATVQMELSGILVNVPGWKRVADRQKLRMFRMQKKISDILQPPGTAMSLFEELPTFRVTDDQIKKRCKELGIQLPVVVNRKTKEPERDKKTGDVKVTVSMDALEPIKDQHPLFPLVIKHASLKKAWTSYGYRWLEHINPRDGRVHASFKQIGTETGRFACVDPNLQQIPQELIYRRNFIAAPEHELGWADYSQIELRILAEMTGDEAMIAAFKSGKDFHTATAASLFGVDINNVTSAQRRLAKDINFGVVYGIGAARFAASAKITVEEAEAMLNDYFNTYTSLKAWLDEARRKGAVDKEVRTMSGRLFRPKFDDNDRQARSLAERNGMNMPIQGTSADMTKIAMSLLKRRNKDISKMVNVAHDEIITEYLKRNREVATKLLVDCMIEAGEVFLKRVPVKVDLKTGPHWSK